VATPHDALFKHAFADPVHAAGLLRSVLPQEVTAVLDWSSLRLCQDSFVDAGLAAHHADLLFQVRLAGRAAFVYVLLEHKSRNDPLTPFHLLRYVVRIWERHLRQVPRPRRLPLVLPVVVHHGRSAWKGPPDFAHLVDSGGLPLPLARLLRRFTPDFRFLLDDLTRASQQEIEARSLTAFARLVLLCLQRLSSGRNIARAIRALAGAMRAMLRSPRDLECLRVVIRYLLFVSDLPASVVQRILRVEVGPEAEELMVSTGQRMVQKAEKVGYARGAIEGRAEGQRTVLLRLLAARFGELPGKVRQQLLRCTPAELEQWTERILTARTLEEVFAPEKP
jgi:hypothetical protein